MSPKMRKRLVIDANLLRAASGSAASQAAASSAVLNTVYKLCHRAAVNAALLDEWDRHSGREGRRWRVEMEKRGKVIEVETESHWLRAQLDEVFPVAGERREVTKDLHLLELAGAADRVILSIEKRAPALLRRQAGSRRALEEVTWHNPVVDTDRTVRWLRSGARRDDAPE
jgi:hypothetical protein